MLSRVLVAAGIYFAQGYTFKKLSTTTYAWAARNYRRMNKFDYDYSTDKLITITPGGLLGYYMFGTTKYIKDNYELDNSYIYSGASAGAWNSLFMSFKGETNTFTDIILQNKNINNIESLQNNLKTSLLENFNEDDFNLNKLNIGVSTLNNSRINLNIYNNFDTLEDAIDCCIISSHIPFITGKPCKKYKNLYSFDGGLFSYPYLKDIDPYFKISPNIWNREFPSVNIFNTKNIDHIKLFNEGYEDSYSNREKLDELFKKR